MSLNEACAWTLLRSLLIGLLALPICRSLWRLLISSRGAKRKLAWTLLLVPFFFPELLVGYAYSNFSLSLVRHPNWNELLYDVLLCMKLIPVGTVVLYFAPPPPISREALHCFRLAFRDARKTLSRVIQWAGFRVRGPVRSDILALGVMFLLAFQEFEMSSLMGTTSWSVRLMAALRAGLGVRDPLDLLRHSLTPLACQAVVLVPVLLIAFKGHSLTAASHQPSRRLPSTFSAGLGCYLSAAAIAICVVPFAIVGNDTPAGFGMLFQNSFQIEGLSKEIVTGLAFAVVSGIGAYGIATWVLSPVATNRFSRLRATSALALSVPGLLGSFILGLLLLFLFQRRYLSGLYDTPVLPLAGLILFLLPRALLLQLLLRAIWAEHGLHLSRLLMNSPNTQTQDAGRELIWQMRTRGHFWAIVLICFWAYLELTLTSLLAPTGMFSASVRLYNEMHYGRNAVLSAMTCVAIAVPVLLVILALLGRRYLLRLSVR